jgi:hypothetical protein
MDKKLMNRIYIFSTKDKISTSRYFQKSSKNVFRNTHYLASQKDFDIIKNKIRIKDIFLFIDPTTDFPLGIEKIKCLKIAYLIDTHISQFHLNHRLLISNFFDCIFLYYKQHLNNFIKFKYPNVKNLEQTKDIHWLPVACDPELHYKNIKNKRNYDIAFVGQIGPSTSFRHKFLKKIFFSDNLTNIEKKYTNGISDKLMSKIYGNSKIVPNVSINKDINMRYFETMAAGCLLLTNKIKNSGVDKLFTENIDYVSYSDERDAIKKIKFYLKNNLKRIKISKNGQKKVLAYNTYENRLKNIINLSKNLKNNSSSKNFSSIKLAEEYTKIYSILRRPDQIIKVIQIYGFNFFIFKNLILSTLRLINVHIPLTRNALKQYFFIKKINKLYYKV